MSQSSSFMHKARGECVSHSRLERETDEVLIDADSALAPTLTLLFLSEGGSKSRKIRDPPAGTHTQMHTHSQILSLCPSSLWPSWPTYSYMTATMWSGWQNIESDYFTVNKLSPLSRPACATDHWPLTGCWTNWLLCYWLITGLMITATGPAWTHSQSM